MGIIAELDRHPRAGDILEVMRRWEDVRAKKWLTPEQKQLLRDPKREFHLYTGGTASVPSAKPYELVYTGGTASVPSAKPYELVEWRQLAVAGRKDGPVRAFVFERGGKRIVAHWHTSGTGTLDLGAAGRLAVGNLAYWTTDQSVAETEKLFASARLAD